MKAVREWHEKNGNVPLRGGNGKTELMAIYQELVPGKSTEQADQAVRTAIKKFRPLISPESTKKGLKKREVGQLSSGHPIEKKKVSAIYNPINNPINNGRKKAKLAETNRAELLANPHISKDLLTEDQLKSEVKTILSTSFVELGDKVLKNAMQSGRYSVYVGMTRRALEDEFLRFLTQRGTLLANGWSSSCKNRPILMKDEGFTEHFTGKQAIEQLGAVCVEVFCSRLRANASAVEDRLQTFIKETLEVKYPQRLFRDVAKGIKREDEDTVNGEETSVEDA